MIRTSTVAELEAAPSFLDLLAEYAAESAIEGLPTPSAKMETYHHLERSGFLHVLAAWAGDTLVGFITVLAAPLPHYGRTVAVSESFFVAVKHRGTGAGLKLLRAAEELAAKLGSPGLLVSAPYEGDLFKVLPRVGYAETNRVFFKAVGQ
jgi:GNAT superfamily N-acetyltransferase